MRDAWATADLAAPGGRARRAVPARRAYRSSTSDPNVGFDCSGLTAYAWGRAGLEIPHQSGSQISAAGRRDASTAVAGDLVQYPGHVSMWLGVGEAIVHASNPENDVELSFDTRSVRYGDPHGLSGSLAPGTHARSGTSPPLSAPVRSELNGQADVRPEAGRRQAQRDQPTERVFERTRRRSGVDRALAVLEARGASCRCGGR